MNWSDVAQIAQTVALLLIAGALIVLAVALGRLLQILTQLESSLDGVAGDVRPLLTTAHAVAQDLQAVSERLRGEADRAGDLAQRAVGGLDETLGVAGDRLERLNELIEMIQAELEDTAIGALSFLRGLRAGASVLRRRRRRRGEEVA